MKTLGGFSMLRAQLAALIVIFYAKLEDHLLHGTGLGYYESTNPNGLKPNSNILAAKIGFSF